MKFLRIAGINSAVFGGVICLFLGADLSTLAFGAGISAYGILIGGAVYWGAKRVLRLSAGGTRLVSALVACALALAYPVYLLISMQPKPGYEGDGHVMGLFYVTLLSIPVGVFALVFGAGVGQDEVRDSSRQQID